MGEIGLFLILIVIGAAVGIAMLRYGHNWLGRQVAGMTSGGDVTYALVGIAGSFMGFHIGAILGTTQFVACIFAVAGAALTLWLWRGR